MNTAQMVRQSKERHPEQFCPVPRCLWRIKGHDGSPRTPCGKHPVAPPHTIQVSGADEPRDRDWQPINTEIPLDRTRAFELAQTLAATGEHPHVRVMEGQRRVLLMSYIAKAGT